MRGCLVLVLLAIALIGSGAAALWYWGPDVPFLDDGEPAETGGAAEGEVALATVAVVGVRSAQVLPIRISSVDGEIWMRGLMLAAAIGLLVGPAGVEREGLDGRPAGRDARDAEDQGEKSGDEDARAAAE